MESEITPADLEDDKASNVVPIIDGRPITSNVLDLFLQTLGVEFQRHVDEEGREPTILYVALTTRNGPLYTCIDSTQDAEVIRHSEAEAKIYFNLHRSLTINNYKL